ncbi:MAG: hypothetical protein IPH79_12750 [Sphingomonadales bacterium]|uniref:hypothetical protein n=1 Tax=Caldilinea sp. TaxID=2293560 RepID=UPI002BEFAD8F|nr:hypothetical protein [Sphingomonadales bacterium]HQY95070.1 hypothetical protein [Caldilinea sp.]
MKNLRTLCISLLEFCERQFRLLELSVPPPEWVPWEGSFNWRYVEKQPTQMLVQKLARQITGLKALDHLFLKGLLQEVGVMFRVLDELSEDISYISLAMANDNWTENHTRYSDYFWSEDDEDRQPPVPRKKIRAYINRVFDLSDPSSADSVGRVLHKTYSDYIHARSAPTMGMVCGPPAQFELDGIADINARRPYVEQIPSYFYRAAMSTVVAAKVVLPENLSAACYEEFCKFERDNADLLFPDR